MSDVVSIKPAELRISFVLSTAIILQSAMALIWAGAAGERLRQLEERSDSREQIIERTARLEEQMIHLRLALDRIEGKIDAYPIKLD